MTTDPDAVLQEALDRITNSRGLNDTIAAFQAGADAAAALNRRAADSTPTTGGGGPPDADTDGPGRHSTSDCASAETFGLPEGHDRG